MNKFLLVLFLFFSFLPVHAQYVLNDDSFAVDDEQKIVLSNFNIDVLNDIHSNAISALFIGGKVYIFANPAEDLEIGKSYTVYRMDGQNYRLYFTELPIIRMTTAGEIADAPKVLGNFEILYTEEEKISGLIGVEYRGNTSQSFPKKSMEIEFWEDPEGNETQEISLAGLPAQDSWNLQAMYNEDLKLNNKSSFELWEKIYPNAHYKDEEPESRTGIRMEYSELFLNGKYMGLYAIGEKVKRGYLKLKKFKNNQIKGELYKGDDWGGTEFTTLIPFDNNSETWNGFEYKYPNEVIDWNNLYNLLDFVINAPDETFYTDFENKFIKDNILDYFLFINVLRAADNTGKNNYFARYKDNDGYLYRGILTEHLVITGREAGKILLKTYFSTVCMPDYGRMKTF